MLSAVLCKRRGKSYSTLGKPFRAERRYLAAALSSQKQQSHDHAEAAQMLCGGPDVPDLLICQKAISGCCYVRKSQSLQRRVLQVFARYSPSKEASDCRKGVIAGGGRESVYDRHQIGHLNFIETFEAKF